MRTIAESNLNMILAVQGFLLNNAGQLASLPNIGEIQNLLDGATREIRESWLQVELNQYGLKTGKAPAKERLIALLTEISRKFTAYALASHETLLHSQVHITKSTITKLTPIELVDLGTRLSILGKEHLATLSSFGITEESLTQLNALLSGYQQQLSDFTAMKIYRSQQNEKVNHAFKVAMETIHQLDALMEIVHDSNPSVYAGYKSSRKVARKTRKSKNAMQSQVNPQ